MHMHIAEGKECLSCYLFFFEVFSFLILTATILQLSFTYIVNTTHKVELDGVTVFRDGTKKKKKKEINTMNITFLK